MPARFSAFIEAIRAGDLPLVRRLIEPSLLEIADDSGWTPLFEAVAANDAEIVAILVESNANLAHRDAIGWSAQDYAAANNAYDIASMLASRVA